MLRQALIVAILPACGGTPATPQAPPLTHAVPTATASVTEAAEPARDPDAPHEGALCFGGHGPTDIRAFDRVAIQIFEKHEAVAAIGTCRIVDGPSQSGFHEITILAGTTPVAVLHLCGGKALVRGITYGRGGPQIGDSTQLLAAYANLACRADVGGYWCFDETIYDPIDRYFVPVPGTATAAGGSVVQGPAAVALIAGKIIAGASYTTRCD